MYVQGCQKKEVVVILLFLTGDAIAGKLYFSNNVLLSFFGFILTKSAIDRSNQSCLGRHKRLGHVSSP